MGGPSIFLALATAYAATLERFAILATVARLQPVAAVLPARQMIFDVIGDLLADRRQLKQLVVDDRIAALLGKLPINGR